MAQDVEIEKNWLEEPCEKPAQVEEKAYGEIEERVTAPELKPEGSFTVGLSRNMEVRIEYCDSGNEAERQQCESSQNTEGSSQPAQLCLIVVRLCDGRFYRSEPTPAPRPLVSPMPRSSVCFAECFPKRGMAYLPVFSRSPEMELFSASCHADGEIVDIL